MEPYFIPRAAGLRSFEASSPENMMLTPPVFLPHVGLKLEMQNHKISVSMLYKVILLPGLVGVGKKEQDGEITKGH